MKKNGFTLIELLAVIVILAIIALIATPIILGIINDARKESQERSIELYASAVRTGIAAYQLREMKEVAAGSYTSETLPFDVEYDGDVVCTTIDIYDNGGVYVAGCEVNDLEVDYTYGTKQIIKGKMSSVCKPISVQTEGTYTAGDKYECDVDPNKEGYDYTFYVLNSTSTEVNLIMDRNICEDGTEATESNTCTYAWYADEMNNSYGPVTAMTKLNAATSKWDNVLSLNTTYNDEGNHFTNFALTGKARLPYKSEITDYSESANNAYLYDNLGVDCYDDEVNETSCDEATVKYGVFEEGIEHIQGVWGYWTLSSRASGSSNAWIVDYNGFANYGSVRLDGNNGVRPVINLSI